MNEIDDSNLAQCCSCGFVDYWDEIPGGHCAVSGESMYYCPSCDEVDNMADYTVERAARFNRFCCDGECNQGRDCVDAVKLDTRGNV